MVRQSQVGGVSVALDIASRLKQGESPVPGKLTAEQLVLLAQYGRLTRKHLGGFLDRLFADFTGLHFHLAWAPTSPDGEVGMLPATCLICSRLAGARSSAQPVCQVCGPKHLARTLSRDGEGLEFKCRQGMLNYWLPVRVRDTLVAIAYLQALDGKPAGSEAGRRLGGTLTRVLNRAEFNRASRLLRLMVQYVQTLDLAELDAVELTNARRIIRVLETEQARWRQPLPSSPAGSVPTIRPKSETHGDQVVQQLLECVTRNYSRPITLQQCAARLKMNTAYLSALFSRGVGRSFKTHLTELRIGKAKAFLGDPTRTISEVARLVGYASENRFRIVFKQVTGLSPRSWRETMQVG